MGIFLENNHAVFGARDGFMYRLYNSRFGGGSDQPACRTDCHHDHAEQQSVDGSGRGDELALSACYISDYRHCYVLYAKSQPRRRKLGRDEN